jgi:ribosomal protein L16 Arg81 hydroxylase
MRPTNLHEVLQPCSPQEFLSSIWGKTFRHIPGPADKFADLLPWPRFNALLREHHFVFPRMRLSIDGKFVPNESFVNPRPGPGGQTFPQVDVVKLNDLLRQGATLIVNAVQEMVEPIAELAEEVERSLQELVSVNAYASWGTVAGFGDTPHQDDHEVIVMQVAGRKRWKLYGLEGEAPLASTNGNGTSPRPEPVFDRVLQPGDFLYVPRGCWHAAVAVAEPTLHLTFGCAMRTGADFLRWLHHELGDQPGFQKKLPRFAGATERKEHVRRLREEVLAACDDDAFDRFFAALDALATPRPRFSFPWSATPATLPPTDSALVQCTVPRAATLHPASEGEEIELCANGEKWLFARAAEPVLQPLLDGQPHSIAALCARAADTLDREQVREFLGELLRCGLLAVVAVPEEPPVVDRAELVAAV